MKRLFAMVFLCAFLMPYAYGETITNSDGSRYVGEVFNGKPHGQGTFTYPDGAKYVGEWKGWVPHGHGTMVLTDGTQYAGDWKDGERTGQGTFTWAGGNKYVGEWKDDKKHGQGTFTWADGNKYVGEYKDGKENGQGTRTYANGEKYVGEWKDGKKHGQGTSTLSGDTSVGEYKDDRPWNGVHYNADGTVAATYANGEECKDCKPTARQLAIVREINPSQVSTTPTPAQSSTAQQEYDSKRLSSSTTASSSSASQKATYEEDNLQKLLNTLSCRNCDLRREDLSGANLSGANLHGAELAGANLERADLSNVDLSGAFLGGVILYGANLSGTDLEGVRGLHLAVVDASTVWPNDFPKPTAVARSSDYTGYCYRPTELHFYSFVDSILNQCLPNDLNITEQQFSDKSLTEALAPAIPNLNYGRYRALVIGNNDYNYLGNLKNAINDAQGVASLLEHDYGFEVDLLKNATRSEIIKALAGLRGTVGPQDNLLIYYAGHGHLDEAADEGYWLPVDSHDEKDPSNWLATDRIVGEIRAMKAKHVMIVADSCFSGDLTRGLRISQQRIGDDDYLQKLIKGKARMALTSGGLKPVVDFGGGKYSVFAKFFISLLKENTGVLDASSLFSQLRLKVMNNSDQEPEYGPIHKAGHEQGDFLFVRIEQ
jgi:hypothetical protein